MSDIYPDEQPAEGLPAFLTGEIGVKADPTALPELTGPQPPAEAPFHVDTRGLAAYKGDVTAWAAGLQHAIEASTGVRVSQDGLAYFLADFAHDAKLAEARSIAFGIANLTVSEQITGDPADLVLRFRDQVAAQTRQRHQAVPTGA